MFKLVRRILAALGLDGAFQAHSPSRSDARISLVNITGEHQPDRLVGMEAMMTDARSIRPVPRLVLCGEFSAGKSSIVNLLLGCDLLPTGVLPSTRRPILLRYAPDLRIDAILETGAREPMAPDAVGTTAREDISRFEMGMPSIALRDMDVLDTPGFADPFHDLASTLEVIETADIFVWCTLATQAWRESERQTWLCLPANFRTRSILVVTHVDALAHVGDQERVRTRLEREAGDLFGDIVFLAVPDAMRARRNDGQVVDHEMWQKSGGNALAAALQRLISDHHLNRRGESAGAGRATDVPPASTGIADVAIVTPTDALGTTTAPDTIAFLAESEAPPEPQAFLAQLAAKVPAFLAAGWIDLAERKVLAFYRLEPAVNADTGPAGDAIAELFQGSNVKRIETLLGRSSSQTDDQTHYLQEIFIVTNDCLGVFFRSKTRADRALAIVSDKSANLGMVIATARPLMKSADLMV